MNRRFEYQFECDPVKARQNARKHAIAFERAAAVFLDPRSLSKFDEEHSHHEDRWVTLGLGRTATLLVVCHTFHEPRRDAVERTDTDHLSPESNEA